MLEFVVVYRLRVLQLFNLVPLRGYVCREYMPHSVPKQNHGSETHQHHKYREEQINFWSQAVNNVLCNLVKQHQTHLSCITRAIMLVGGRITMIYYNVSNYLRCCQYHIM
jgi:hypothetical protein